MRRRVERVERVLVSRPRGRVREVVQEEEEEKAWEGKGERSMIV